MSDTNVTREMQASAPHWDALQTGEGRDALALVQVMAHGNTYRIPGTDPADVASVAGIILAGTLAAGFGASDGARVALRKAVRAMLRDRGHDLPALSATGEDVQGEAPSEPVRPMPAGRCPRYVGADTTTGDTLRTVLALARPYLTDRQASIMREVAWADGERGMPFTRIARNLGESGQGRSGMRTAQEIRETLALVQEIAANVLTHDTTGRKSARPAPLAHFTRRLGAAPALPVPVRAGRRGRMAGDVTPRIAGTSDHGYRWSTGQSTKEADRAGIIASTDATTRTAGRPCGVGAGMCHGTGSIAGAGTPTPRPVASRKRKGGGQTGPTVPDRR